MAFMERGKKVDMYLKSTITWKNVLQKLQIPVLNGENIIKHSVTVSPWSIDQIALSIGCSKDELLKLIPKRERIRVTYKVLENETFTVLEMDDEINLDVALQPNSIFKDDMDIHLLIRLLVWMNTKRICDQTGEMPSLSDAILTVKNELMIPDDFMPGYMMQLVESGTTGMNAEKVNDIQGKDDLLYVICGFDQDRIAYPVSIIPSAGFSIGSQLDLYEKFMNKVKELFSETSKTREFQNLTVSRTLRALIYQLEKNKRRDLSGYLWKGEKMTILKSLDLVDESEGKPTLKSDVDLQKLTTLASIYRAEAEKLSANWLKTKVSFP